jgi:fumarate hydratase subunit alpha
MLDARQVADAVRAAVAEAAVTLRPDVLAAIRAAAETETSERGRRVLSQLVENAETAAADRVPLCQDTGTVWVRVTVGSDECLTGDLHGEVDRAVAEAYRAGGLRMSTVRDALLDRSNAGDNSPAFIQVSQRPGTGATVEVMLKGGGSDNASVLAMLDPSAGWTRVRDLVLETVRLKATGACPPLVIGVGVGATFDRVGALAKSALLRQVGSAPADARLVPLERELLDAVNATGIGPAGLGGATTALAVHIATAPCHIAALPVAVNMGCNAVRSATVEVR